MNFQDAITSGFKRYIDFNGRSSRSEYWYWILGFCAVYLVYGVAIASHIGILIALVALVLLGLFLPSLAVAVRRLHDTNRSGWWYLLALTGIGGILLLVWYCTRGTIGENQFGPDPLEAMAAPSKPDSAWAS
jgi:uncharacterized membrane protein YhaH (DUF805 family)